MWDEKATVFADYEEVKSKLTFGIRVNLAVKAQLMILRVASAI